LKRIEGAFPIISDFLRISLRNWQSLTTEHTQQIKLEICDFTVLLSGNALYFRGEIFHRAFYPIRTHSGYGYTIQDY